MASELLELPDFLLLFEPDLYDDDLEVE